MSVRIIQSIIIRVLDSTARRSSGYNVYHDAAYTVTVLGHFGLGHFGLGRFGLDISATDVSATENAKGGRFGHNHKFLVWDVSA